MHNKFILIGIFIFVFVCAFIKGYNFTANMEWHIQLSAITKPLE